MQLSSEEKLILLGGVVFLFFGPQIISALTRQTAKAATGAVIDGATGAVVGVGEGMGIPATDPGLCAQAMQAGDGWSVSKYCPALTFLKWSTNQVVGQ